MNRKHDAINSLMLEDKSSYDRLSFSLNDLANKTYRMRMLDEKATHSFKSLIRISKFSI